MKILFLLLLILLPLASGLEADTYSQYSNINFSDTCTVNGFPCDTSFACNFSVKLVSPNQKILINQLNASRSGDYWYIPYNYTADIGAYEKTMYCWNSSVAGQDTSNFYVTPNGNTYTNSQTILYSVLFFFTLFLLILTFYGALTIQYSNYRDEEGKIFNVNWMKYLKLFCIAMSYALLVAILFFAWNISYAILYFGSMANLFHILYRICFAFGLPAVLILFVIAIQNLINDNKLWSSLERGINPRD